MGFFGLFAKKRGGLDKHAERAGNKRAQAPDRWESIQVLGKIATRGEAADRSEAVAALLMRFTFYVDPSITDGEEKDEAFRWVCEAGEASIEPVCRALRKHESLSWPLKCLEALVPEGRVIEEMIALLDTMGKEYERDPQRKLQLLGTLEQKKHPKIAETVAPFFLDVNETARFHAVGAAMAQDEAESIFPQLLEMLAEEDSVRVKVRALEAISARGWTLGEGKDRIQVPDGWLVDSKGVPRKAKKK